LQAQTPLRVPVVGSAHCGNEALLHTLAAFAAAWGMCTWKNFVVHLAIFWVHFATFCGVLGCFF